jgi:hypothetical protein
MTKCGQHWKATLISLLSKDYLLEDEQRFKDGGDVDDEFPST